MNYTMVGFVLGRILLVESALMLLPAGIQSMSMEIPGLVQTSLNMGILRLEAEEGRIRQVYPDFDWQRELASPQFGRLVTAGVDGQTAYEIVHRQELLQAAMGYAAEKTRSEMARAIASGGSRAAENRGGSRTVTRSDPRSLTSRELAAIRRRVQDGEKIRF